LTIKTSPRARAREDRAGEPLDGLVNLFDLGIVLAVAFLLAALSSLKLTGTLGTLGHATTTSPHPQIVINNNQSVHDLTVKPDQRVVGQGTAVGTVYRLQNGQLIYVTPTKTGTKK
jgi:hypothetical protein